VAAKCTAHAAVSHLGELRRTSITNRPNKLCRAAPTGRGRETHRMPTLGRPDKIHRTGCRRPWARAPLHGWPPSSIRALPREQSAPSGVRAYQREGTMQLCIWDANALGGCPYELMEFSPGLICTASHNLLVVVQAGARWPASRRAPV
jgi:hypothetical protein